VKIAVNNVHLDLGAGRRGTDMGPSAMHVAGLVERLERLGNHVQSMANIGHINMEASDAGDPKARFLSVIHGVCHNLAEKVFQQMQAGYFPLVLGGDHSQAIGTVSGMARHLRESGGRLGVLWVDAHTDLNTPETSPTGNIHGMPLATLLGKGARQLVDIAGPTPALAAEHVVVFGARDVDAGEAEQARETGVRVYTMSEIDYRGMRTCLDEALARISEGTAGIHLSFDLDGVDPVEAPGTGTPVPGGLTLREAHLLCETLAKSGRLLSMEMVELNPTLDERNKTAKLAVWLIESALGRRILGQRAASGDR